MPLPDPNADISPWAIKADILAEHQQTNGACIDFDLAGELVPLTMTAIASMRALLLAVVISGFSCGTVVQTDGGAGSGQSTCSGRAFGSYQFTLSYNECDGTPGIRQFPAVFSSQAADGGFVMIASRSDCPQIWNGCRVLVGPCEELSWLGVLDLTYTGENMFSGRASKLIYCADGGSSVVFASGAP
jgi:hypothetical protein